MPDAFDCLYVVRRPHRAELERAGRRLYEVLLLAEALPVRHTPTLQFPPLTRFVQSEPATEAGATAGRAVPSSGKTD